MCCRITIISSIDELEEYFHKQIIGSILLPNYNIAPQNKVPILLPEKENIITAFWGIKLNNILNFNTRIETILEKSLLQKKYIRSVVISSGYFEWAKLNNKKQPYFINTESKFSLLASLYNAKEETLSIITKPAFKFIEFIHNRMPLIIREELLNIWLNDDVTFNEFYNTYIKNDEFQLNFRKVSPKVNNVKYNNADIFKFTDEEITLF